MNLALNWQWDPSRAAYVVEHPNRGGCFVWHPDPNPGGRPAPSPFTDLGNVPLPQNWGQPIERINNLDMPRPWQDQHRPDDDRPYWVPVNDPRHRPPLPPRWGEPIERTFVHNSPRRMDMPRPAIELSGWGQPIESVHEPHSWPRSFIGDENHHHDVDSAFPSDVPHNNDAWPWNVDGHRPVSPGVARRRFSMRRPARGLRRRASRTGLDEFTLGPRPTDWRPDYPARPPGLLGRLSLVRQSRFPRLVGPNYTLNSLLLYDNPEDYPICYDLRQEPEVIDIVFMNLDRPSNSLDFCQLATAPPVDELCLWHPRLPWYVNIRASQSNGITIQDVLCQLHDSLAHGIHPPHYYTVELSARDREEIRGAFLYRCDGVQERQDKGITRMDFLRFNCVFLGLAKSRDGMWEIKTREATP